MMANLDATITFRCERVRHSNGAIAEILFQNRVANGRHSHDEILLCNLLRDRGLPVLGQEYEITIRPVELKDSPKVDVVRHKPHSQPRTATMSKTYQGKPVTNVRDAKEGDPSFDAAKDQVIVRNADGTESTVLRSDVKDK